MSMTLNHTDPHKTIRNVLPYRIVFCPNGKVAITNVRNQTIYVTRDQVLKQLAHTDLDVRRRRMYEAALEEFPKSKPFCTCLDPVHEGDDPNCPIHGSG